MILFRIFGWFGWNCGEVFVSSFCPRWVSQVDLDAAALDLQALAPGIFSHPETNE